MDWEVAKRNAVREIVDTLDTADMVRLYNEMAEKNNYTPIYENTDEMLDELFSSPSNALCEVCGSNYRYTDKYLHYDVYLWSFNYDTDEGSPIDAGEITSFLVREGSGFGVFADDDPDLIEALCEYAGEPEDGEFADWLVGEDLMYADWDCLYESWKESKEDEGDE